MKIRTLASLTLAAALAATAALYAETMNVKLGLWEVTITTQMSGAPPIDMSKIPPERRAQVEAMMKEQFGGAPKTDVRKECMTKEKLEKDLFNDNDKSGECKQTAVTRTATVQDIKFECSNGTSKSTGEMRFEAQSTENVTGTITANVDANGHAMAMNSKFTGKWMAASCGDVK